MGRIILLGMSGMLRDLIREVVAPEPDIEIVGELEEADGQELEVLADAVGADFVIAGLVGHRLPETCERVLTRHPGVRVLGLSAEGRGGVLYELRPQATLVGELSPRLLIELIRRGPPSG